MEEFKQLAESLKGLGGHDIVQIRKQIEWMDKMIDEGKLVASETVLMGYLEDFRQG